MRTADRKLRQKDIAFQAGISLATLDRAMHGRGHVHPQTLQRINEAIGELERQNSAALQSGRRFTIDVVMEAPERFSRATRVAFEAEMPSMRPASFRCRFHLAESREPADLLATLARIRKRGSHGVVLKAPDLPEVARAVTQFRQSGIPVITFVTDITNSERNAYVGMDNIRAGATAAHLISTFLTGADAQILVSLSSNLFTGEQDRFEGFRAGLAKSRPGLRIVLATDAGGTDRQTGALISKILETHPGICAVYSSGGGNRAILAAFEKMRRPCGLFVAHDLDSQNLALIEDGAIKFVIHHDLREDARRACQQILAHHRMLTPDFRITPSSIHIACRENLPDS